MFAYFDEQHSRCVCYDPYDEFRLMHQKQI